ncbi:MAG TPA: CBS domain-containing protein [Alphaproteobacteria bacterium]|nr:CBS domain-containing protein [Alphaproteobacteria bacterium]
MKVQDVMTRDVQVIKSSMLVSEAALLMRDGDYGVLPVVKDGLLAGMVTDRDIAIRAVAAGKQPTETRVEDIMSEGVSWAYEDEDAEIAARRMQDRQIRRLPVIDREKHLTGIVSIGDFAVEAAELKSAARALKGVSEGAELHQ